MFFRSLGISLWTAAAIAAVTLCAAAASAQLRVVVEDFRGPQAGSLRNGLVRNLQEEGLEVVPREEVGDTALELGITRRTYRREDYVQLAQTLQVSAFLQGRVSRARRRWAMTVVVISGETGEEVGRASWGGRTVGSLGSIRRNGYARLEEYLAGGEPPPAAQPEQSVQQGDQPWWARGQQDTETAPIREEEEEEEDDPIQGEARQTWLSLALLGGSLRRSMEATAEVASPRDMPGSGSTSPELRTYESAGIGHMELGLAAEFWPGAVGAAQKVPWFGVVGHYRHSLFLTSFGCPRRMSPTDPCLPGTEIEVPTSQDELYVGARGRYRFGEDSTAPEIQADIGYGAFNFVLDVAALQNLERPSILPPLAYTYVNFGVGGFYPFHPQWLTAGVRAAYRLGLGVGEDAQRVWGVDTTDTGGFLVGVSARSQAPYVAPGVFIGLDIEYFQFTTTYRGQTACVNPGDDGVCYSGDATTPAAIDPGESWEPWPHGGGNVNDVIGGIQNPVTDNYLRLSLAIGYALR